MAKPIDTERRLVAIFAADVEGYTRLMGADEVGTMRDLTQRRRTLDGLIASHRGRIANTAGDSVLAEFGSAVDAVRCAVEAQEALTEANGGLSPDRQINFRIGVHVGDVMIRGGDLFGDAVNVAARLQTLASAGGTCISGVTHAQVRKLLPYAFVDLGPQQVKNLEEPIQTFAVTAKGSSPNAASSNASVPLTLPDKPSIAVLPFQNMSGDPEQEYFADGMVEEITTALSRFKALFVIARNSSFTYKGRAVDIKQVGRELGVRYILEGSVRKASGRVRITGQLIDAAIGSHLWADRFEGDLRDVFALQDQMTESVVSAIAPRLLQAEIELATRRRPDNLSAYDIYLRAAARLYSYTREGSTEALQLLYRALEIDPRYGVAASLAASCHLHNISHGWAVDPKSTIEEATRLSRLALNVDENDPEALAIAGRVTAFSGDIDAAIELVDRAVALNPNSANAWNRRGLTYRHVGQPDEALRSFERAIRLSPVDPWIFLMFTGMGIAFIDLQRFDEAAAFARKALRKNQVSSMVYRCLAVALAHLGREAEAKEAVTHMLQLEPNFRIAEWVARTSSSKLEVFIEGLRKAGLPE
ncbi:adenylate/guanylate cyclase domain-containing protein [Bradyrhizobium iriomotense]|uniref:Adenylate cyclase n=1 Tax=Bradyrhizobium iriomotense TaxID=441950 RepID=A0ABQ6B4M6_9BRAD|nr:adenylate/guanylate cyclase domain-containing protein [Bradyrhizobium iriomotense]GLR88605.1 adenylate cyclase [Bradyrhizobium iriomotense]